MYPKRKRQDHEPRKRKTRTYKRGKKLIRPTASTCSVEILAPNITADLQHHTLNIRYSRIANSALLYTQKPTPAMLSSAKKIYPHRFLCTSTCRFSPVALLRTGGSRGGPVRQWPPPNAEPARPNQTSRHAYYPRTHQTCMKFTMQESYCVLVKSRFPGLSGCQTPIAIEDPITMYKRNWSYPLQVPLVQIYLFILFF